LKDNKYHKVQLLMISTKNNGFLFKNSQNRINETPRNQLYKLRKVASEIIIEYLVE